MNYNFENLNSTNASLTDATLTNTTTIGTFTPSVTATDNLGSDTNRYQDAYLSNELNLNGRIRIDWMEIDFRCYFNNVRLADYNMSSDTASSIQSNSAHLNLIVNDELTANSADITTLEGETATFKQQAYATLMLADRADLVT